jgi:hypothetical protein
MLGMFGVLASLVFSYSVSYSKYMDTGFHSQAIYGSDNRLDLFEVADKQILALADSTVGIVKSERMIEGKSTWQFKRN